jgi:sigma-B regulation protein RsbU (phosphoserine phosphatase)
MPEMDGLTLLTHLLEMNRPYKAIVISAYGDMSNIRSAMNKGASEFITKPIDFQDLEITLNKIILQYNQLLEGASAKHKLTDIEKELEIASRIQQSMIPHDFNPLPKNKHFELSGLMLAAKEVGGDFFDFFQISEDKIGLIIADVSGKSISAALFMAISKILIRSIAWHEESPRETLKKANDLLAYENPSCMFVTAFYAILDTRTGTVCYANAGHNPPYIISKNNTVRQFNILGSTPLGLDPDLLKSGEPLYTQQTLQLNDGDCLFLYTDGITEAMNEKQECYTAERLEETLTQCGNKELPAIIDTVMGDLKVFTEGAVQSDDITVLCLRYYLTGKPIQVNAKTPPGSREYELQSTS